MPPNEIGHSRGGASTKIHAVVDAYGYPVYFMISEGQRNDIYIYSHGGEPTISSRKGAKFDRHCDWWLYKERDLVENYFLKLKVFRRIS